MMKEKRASAPAAGPDYKGMAVRGGAVTLAAQGVKLLLTLASTMVLARLLAPQDFGIVAMVVAIGLSRGV